MLTLIYTVLNQGNVQASSAQTIGTEEDAISLEGQIFPISGMVRGEPVSEFETGVKIGRATYDQREHAFFLVLDDFSGGFGYKTLDIRDELGTFWDSNPENAPDTRRPRHITLGPVTRQVALAPTTVPVMPSLDKVDYGYVALDSRFIYFVVGNAVYALRDGNITADLSDTFGTAPAGYGCAAGSIIFTRGNGAYVQHIPVTLVATNFRGNDGNIWAIHGFGSEMTVVKIPTTSDDTSLGLATTFSHLFVWDNKILAMGPTGLVFGIVSFDISLSPNFVEWNSGVDLDEEVFNLPVENGARFVGVLPSPWGEPAVYMYSDTRLLVLDFFARKIYTIDGGATEYISHAVMWNGEIVYTDGWNVFAYSPNGNTLRNIGFPNKSGAPPSFQSLSGITLINAEDSTESTGTINSKIEYLIPGDNLLWAIVTDPQMDADGGYDSRIFCYNNVGWCQVGEVLTGFFPQGGFTHTTLAYPYAPTSPPAGPVNRRLYVPGIDATVVANTDYYNLFTTQVRLASLDMPLLSNAPTVGVDHFAPGGAYIITGWIDGGFSDIDGTLLRMNIDAYSLTESETIKVEYRLDGYETDWIQLVDSGGVAREFDVNNRVLYFPSISSPRKGIQFRTVQFRVTWNRGTDDTKSPELRALTLVYLKTPPLRTTWTFQIDLNRMIEKSNTGNVTTYYVDGEPATAANVWAKLQTLWNTHPLLELVIPNIELSTYVRLTAMPFTFDDFRNAVDGRGSLTITLVEPVSSG